MDDDWAQKAADGVLADLCDRRGIKQELQRCKYEDEEVWQEIRATLAEIIRRSAPAT